MRFHDEHPVQNVACCINCFSPEDNWKLGVHQHGSCSFNQRSVLAFSYSILLRCSGCTILKMNSFFYAE
ncbi:hypothetical protein HanRHA438_Chr09g0429161 [Helianthus annuus]|nr:hypothetical protein HanIR_Chr09g0449421 [Helianthus annuus]KAJ0890921.1 hypothetical protein HanRHA438_Chr09g0429161 [Helianthus annuus]